MTQAIQPYQEPAQQLPGPPTEFHLSGHRYVLVPTEHQLPAVHQSKPTVINGVPHVFGPQGYQPVHELQSSPYHAHSAHPPWLRNHYTRGTGILIGAACIGAVLFIVAAALYAIVTWALANLVAIGIAIIVVFFGGMVLLGKMTSMRHGHPIRR